MALGASTDVVEAGDVGKRIIGVYARSTRRKWAPETRDQRPPLHSLTRGYATSRETYCPILAFKLLYATVISRYFAATRSFSSSGASRCLRG